MSMQSEQRRKRFLLNTATSMLDEVVALVAAFILPRAILGAFGSEVNGLVSSITQFLGMISFLDLGVGAVVSSALYKPLANKDDESVSRILKSAQRFFRRIAMIFLVYIAILIVIYPIVMDLDIFSTIALILAISITQFAKYYFGVVNQILLGSDQRSYIPVSLNVGTVILNLIFSLILIELGSPIYMVKLASSMIFLLRPIGMGLYVRNHYNVDRNIEIGEEPIKQKWDGMAQHIAGVVMDNTDVTVLTLFSTLENISVYSVYYTVVHGIRMVVDRLFDGMKSLIGELYAREEKEYLDRIFREFEFVNHGVVVFFFSCTGVLLVPFIRVYTDGITDADYIAPVFAALLALSQAVMCLRIPYHMMVKAAGHFRQTQIGAIAETVINIVVSVVAVNAFGLAGIAVGTLCAMLLRTYYLWIYSFRHLLNRKLSEIIKLTLFDVVVSTLIIVVGMQFPMKSVSYLSWVVTAFEVCGCGLFITLAASMLCYRRESVGAVRSLLQKKRQ